MNRVLWPATLGYFPDQFLGGVLPGYDPDAWRDYFAVHVHGRGPLPAVRVGRQPYGILPVLAPEVADEVDRRVVASPRQAQAMLAAVEAMQPELTAFFGCLYNACMHAPRRGGLPARGRLRQHAREGWACSC